jgi:hypothetical protein
LASILRFDRILAYFARNKAMKPPLNPKNLVRRGTQDLCRYRNSCRSAKINRSSNHWPPSTQRQLVNSNLKSMKREIRYWPCNSTVVPRLEITLIAPEPFARIKIETKKFEEIKSYAPVKTIRTSGRITDLKSSFSITDRAIFGISKCLRDEPLGKLPSRKGRGQAK